MSQFVPSDIARLVLEYLEDTKCYKSYHAFLLESPHLDECRKVIGSGVKYRRRMENLLSILQEYCDLTSTVANATLKHPASVPIHVVKHNSALSSKKPTDTDSVFTTLDKNTYHNLRKHIIRLQNLVMQFMSSLSNHPEVNSSGVSIFVENKSDLTPLSNSQAPVTSVDTSTRSLKSAETMGHSELASKESHKVEKIISNVTNQASFNADSSKGKIDFPCSSIQKDHIVSQGTNEILNPGVAKSMNLNVAVEELYVSLKDKLEHSSRNYTSASNFSPNCQLPINFASNEQSDDTQRNEVLINHMAHTLNNGCNEQIHISEQNLCENSVIETPAVKTEIVTENSPSCAFPNDTVMINNDSDSIENKLNASRLVECTYSVPMDLTSGNAGTSAVQVASKGNFLKDSPQGGIVRRQVAEQTSDILNRAVVQSINSAPSSEKKDLVQTIQVPAPLPLSIFSGNSDAVQNNATTFMYTFPNTNPALCGMQNNQQICLILCQNPVSTMGNPSVLIPPIVQQVPVTSSSTMNQMATSVSVNSAVTNGTNKFKKKRPMRNLFDLPTENSTLSLHSKTAQDESCRLKLIHPISQPPLSNVMHVNTATMGKTIQEDNQAVSSANVDLTSVKVEISMENPPLKFFTYSSDLSNQDQIVLRKRRFTGNLCDKKKYAKRGRPPGKPKVKKQNLFSHPICARKSPDSSE